MKLPFNLDTNTKLFAFAVQVSFDTSSFHYLGTSYYAPQTLKSLVDCQIYKGKKQNNLFKQCFSKIT